VPGPDLPLVIGIGNEDRSDDGVGPRAARLVLERLGTAVRVAEVPGPVTDLLELWRDAGDVYVIDAVQSGGAPGQIHRFEVGREPIPSRFGSTSTHGLSLSDAVALAASLDSHPRRLVIYGVEVAELGHGPSLSAAVERALPVVVDRVIAEISLRPREA
jgi:hydrogenase maturation protease